MLPHNARMSASARRLAFLAHLDHGDAVRRIDETAQKLLQLRCRFFGPQRPLAVQYLLRLQGRMCSRRVA